MKFIPHDYQQYAIEYIETHEVAAVLLDMGLGKTAITLTAPAVRLLRDHPRPGNRTPPGGEEHLAPGD